MTNLTCKCFHVNIKNERNFEIVNNSYSFIEQN